MMRHEGGSRCSSAAATWHAPSTYWRRRESRQMWRAAAPHFLLLACRPCSRYILMIWARYSRRSSCCMTSVKVS